jgi:tyrosyl-tRNA synthetase
MTMPLLEGTDGSQKMSKSLGNYVGIDESPEQMFGKIMSISDTLMWRYYELLSSRRMDEIAAMRRDTERGANPRDAKLALAKELVGRFHGGSKAGEDALRDFLARFQRHEVPEKMPEIEIPSADGSVSVALALKTSGLTKSTSEAIRKIREGGVRLDGQRVEDASATIRTGTSAVLQLGKRSFVRVVVR